MLIFKGKVHMERWYQDEGLPKDWRTGGLKSVIMDGQPIRLDYDGFKRPSFQLQMVE